VVQIGSCSEPETATTWAAIYLITAMKIMKINYSKLQGKRRIIKRIVRNKAKKDTQITLYTVMAAPFLLYGCENWAVDTVDRR
jgi:hypothetical protein